LLALPAFRPSFFFLFSPNVTNPGSWHVVRGEIVKRQPPNVEQLDRLYLISVY